MINPLNIQVLEERVKGLETREKHCLEAYEKLEEELRGLKARCELLHGDVSKEIKSNWGEHTVGGHFEIEDKPTQTLAYALFKRFPDSWDRIDVHHQDIIDFFAPLLQSEYQRGWQDGSIKERNTPNMKYVMPFNSGIIEGRKQAIGEMKEKFEELVKHSFGSQLINDMRSKVFTESK